MTATEIHPFSNGFVPDNARIIITGTFPPFREYFKEPDAFFYPSPQNHFWNRMENIFPDAQLKRTSKKLAHISLAQNTAGKQLFARQQNIGFLDVFTEIKRKKEGSSRDTDLIPVLNVVENGKLFETLERATSVTRICCTYKLAWNTLIEKLPGNKLEVLPHDESANGLVGRLDFYGRVVSILLLYPATRSGQRNVVKDRQYARLIFGF